MKEYRPKWNGMAKRWSKRLMAFSIAALLLLSGVVAASSQAATKDYSLARVRVGIALDRTRISLAPSQSVKLDYKLEVRRKVAVELNWASSDKSIATVDKNGRVTAHKTGVCVIAAQAGTATAPITVEVQTDPIANPFGSFSAYHYGQYLVVRLPEFIDKYESEQAAALQHCFEGKMQGESKADKENEEPASVEETITEEEATQEESVEPELEEPEYEEPEPEMEEPELEEPSEEPAEEPEPVEQETDEETVEEPEPPDAMPDTSDEKYENQDEQKYFDTVNMPVSTVSVDVDTAAYANVRRFIQNGQLPPADAVRIEEMVNYFRYDYPQPQTDDPVSVTTEIVPCPWNSEHYLAKVALQARSLTVEKLPDSNIVFLVDVSGSMDYDNKLPLLIRSYKLLVEELGENDTVSIVTYANGVNTLIEGVSAKEKDIINFALDLLSAGGSTYGEGGLAQAYETAEKYFLKDGNNRIILGTDGDFNVGISGKGEMEKYIAQRRETGVYLSILGVGMGNYRDDMVKTLSFAGNGNYAYIDTIDEAEKALVADRNGTLVTVAQDVKWQIEWNAETVAQYRLIGYEKRVLKNKDFSNDAVDAGEMGAGHTVTVFYELVPVGVKAETAIQQSKDTSIPSKTMAKDDFGVISVRYKQPGGAKSKLMTQAVTQDVKTNSPSEDTAFASAVAEFGLLLRDSQFKGDASFDSVIERANANKGKDADGYRAAFVKLVKAAKALQ